MKRTPVPKEFLEEFISATEPQLSYLRSLRDGKDLSSLTDEQRKFLADADFDTYPSFWLKKTRASDIIEPLKILPWKPKDKADVIGADVPDGRYAVEKDDGTLMFYSVKNGHSRIFVDVWASDHRWPVKSPAERSRILTTIKNDPDAGPRFGREIGRCYVCGRTLTDEESRQLGIGPICRAA